MALTKNLRPGGKHGLASGETRDPIGYAVAALSRVAQSELLDRIGLRKQAEQTVVHRHPRRVQGRDRRPDAPSSASAPPEARGARCPSATPKGVFDLTPTEDEQMLVDVVGEFAEEVVRPAAAQADDDCAAPERC